MQLGPILFALYVADMSKDLHESGLGVKLHRFTKRFLSYDSVSQDLDARIFF